MANADSSSSTPPSHSSTIDIPISNLQTIPTRLKFFRSHIKTIITTQLTVDNYPIWKSQVFKLFRANGFESHLTGNNNPTSTLPTDLTTSPSNPPAVSSNWYLIDQYLSAALAATISSPLLPYVLSLDTCADIWITVERRLQATNRSRLIQLKGELHHLSMAGKTITQYLAEIKPKVDAISAASSPISPDYLILYTLNGLPSTYQAFKTAIRTNLQPLDIDEFYALLCSEETNQHMESLRLSTPDPAAAFITNRIRGRG